jgi:pimeloyl-ACP methyl ester carboxylesterase
VTVPSAGPDRLVRSADGTMIAVVSSGDGPPVVLVHGTTADHTTWRAAGPVLAGSFTVHAIDRRGRGASGDGAGVYAIEREFEDIAAVADAIAAESGRPVDVVGHSYGGRVALGGALLTANIGRVVVYEGAPSPAASKGYRPAGVEARIRDLIDTGRRDEALETFFREIVRMPAADLAVYRADPIWPVRAAAVQTSLRELEGEASPPASLDALAAVRQPVLQILGGDSAPPFREATIALDGRLANGRVVVIDGARHAAHHTHVEAFVDAVRAFLTASFVAD